jgi:hypothetical protein
VALAVGAVEADDNELRPPPLEEDRVVVARIAPEALRTPPMEAPAPPELSPLLLPEADEELVTEPPTEPELLLVVVEEELPVD